MQVISGVVIHPAEVIYSVINTGWFKVLPGPGYLWANSAHYILGWKSFALIALGALALTGKDTNRKIRKTVFIYNFGSKSGSRNSAVTTCKV